MIPASFVTIERLPMTANGKVDRRSLAAISIVPAVAAIPGVQDPRTPTELLVAEIWRALLHCATVGANENFLDLGGHSLLIMRAVAAIESRSGVRLSPRALVFQTLTQVAAEIDREAAARAEVQGVSQAQVSNSGRSAGLIRRVLKAFRSEKRP